MHLKICFAACFVWVSFAVCPRISIAHESESISTFLVQDSPRPDRWRGLVLDEATPEDAFTVLGKAEKDELDRLRVAYFSSKWISKKHKEKVFRKIRWKENKGLNPLEVIPKPSLM